MMRRLPWRRVGQDVEVADAGSLKLFGRSGAIAETPAGSLSFRAEGGRIGHDASVIRLSDNKEIASFSVGPLHQALTFADGAVYAWRRSFLTQKGSWLQSGERVVVIKRGEIAIEGDVPHSDVLVFFGLYLALSGRA